jgi:hypothetical protein
MTRFSGGQALIGPSAHGAHSYPVRQCGRPAKRRVFSEPRRQLPLSRRLRSAADRKQSLSDGWISQSRFTPEDLGAWRQALRLSQSSESSWSRTDAKTAPTAVNAAPSRLLGILTTAIRRPSRAACARIHWPSQTSQSDHGGIEVGSPSARKLRSSRLSAPGLHPYQWTQRAASRTSFLSK